MLGERVFSTLTYFYPALLASAQGAWEQAAADWRCVLALARELGSTPLTVPCLAGIAGMLTARGWPENGARLLGAVNSNWRLEAAYGVYQQVFHDAYEPALAATRAALNAEAFGRVWAEGQALSLDQAVAEALQATEPTASG